MRQKARALEKHFEIGDSAAKELMDGLERADGLQPSPAFVAYTMIHWTVSIGRELKGYGFQERGRKKTGTISLTKILRSILSDTPLVKNLETAEYRGILLDGSDTLEERFANIAARSVIDKLDAEQNQNEKMKPEMKKIVRLPDLPQTSE